MPPVLTSAEGEAAARLMAELCEPGAIIILLNDLFGNYVLQRALQVTAGSAGRLLAEGIRPHFNSLRLTSAGWRIMKRVFLLFPDMSPPPQDAAASFAGGSPSHAQAPMVARS